MYRIYMYLIMVQGVVDAVSLKWVFFIYTPEILDIILTSMLLRMFMPF